MSKSIIFTLCLIMLIAGCDQGMQKPVMEVITPPEQKPEFMPPSQTPDSLEMAQAAMERVNIRRTEVHQEAESAGEFSSIFPDSERIFREELGFRIAFWVELVDIFRDEKSEDSTITDGYTRLQEIATEHLLRGTFGTIYFDYIRTFDPLIVEYLRLSYEYPSQSEEELLTLFRISVVNDKVLIIFPEDL